MRRRVVSLVAAAALLASVGAADAAENAAAKAKGPVTLTDNQLDTVTAGDAASLLALNYQVLNNLLTLNTNFLAFATLLTP